MNTNRTVSDSSQSHINASKAYRDKEFRRERRIVRSLRNDCAGMLARY